MPDGTPHVLILGGGFGGLSAAHEIRSKFTREQVRVTIIDKKDWFMVGFAKLWIVRGMRTFEESAKSLNGLPDKGIDFVKESVVRIDPQKRQVVTDARTLPYNYLIIAMGASLVPEKIPGLEEFGMNLYGHEDLAEIHHKLKEFKSGRIAVCITGMPYKCPPAPFEASMLVDSLLSELGTRGSVEIDVYSPAPIALPAAGPEVSSQVLQMLESRHIRFHNSCKTVSVEKNRLVFEDGGGADFDLLLAIPPHAAPSVVRESGLAEPGGFIRVSRDCKTEFPDVYAVGDVTSLAVAPGALAPKAGVFAEAEARAVARNIMSRINSEPDSELFDGKGGCFLETGTETAALVQVDLFSENGPSTRLTESTAQHLSEKLEFERERLEKWL